MAFMKSTSWLGCTPVPGSMSHPAGLPVPWGKTTMNPSACAGELNCVVIASNVALSESPWRSTTTGSGAPWCDDGVVSRYDLVTPSTVMFWPSSSTEASAGREHPADATGALVSGAAWPALVVEELRLAPGAEQAPTMIKSTRRRSPRRLPVRSPTVAKHSTIRSGASSPPPLGHALSTGPPRGVGSAWSSGGAGWHPALGLRPLAATACPRRGPGWAPSDGQE